MNPALASIKTKIEQSVPKELSKDFRKMVSASKKLAFSDQTFHYVKEYLDPIQDPAEIPSAVAHGIAKAFSILWNESKGTMVLGAAAPALMVLMIDLLEYFEDVKTMEIPNEVIDQTTLETKDGLLALIKQASNLPEDKWRQLTNPPPPGADGQPSQSVPDEPQGMMNAPTQNVPAPPAPAPQAAAPQPPMPQGV